MEGEGGEGVMGGGRTYPPRSLMRAFIRSSSSFQRRRGSRSREGLLEPVGMTNVPVQGDGG